MSKTKKKAMKKHSKFDGILSEKELEDAIKQYKARRAQREETDEDDDDGLTAVGSEKAKAERVERSIKCRIGRRKL